MHPSASIFYRYKSIEKFLWDNVAGPNSVLLIHQDDVATRFEELKQANLAVIWHTLEGMAGNTGELTLFAAATSIRDPGGFARLVLLDKIKEALDRTAGIAVMQYEESGLITEPVTKVNELAVIGPVHVWPTHTDLNSRYTAQPISQRLKYAQIRT